MVIEEEAVGGDATALDIRLMVERRLGPGNPSPTLCMGKAMGKVF